VKEKIYRTIERAIQDLTEVTPAIDSRKQREEMYAILSKLEDLALEVSA
jgi:hypothetical protein